MLMTSFLIYVVRVGAVKARSRCRSFQWLYEKVKADGESPRESSSLRQARATLTIAWSGCQRPRVSVQWGIKCLTSVSNGHKFSLLTFEREQQMAGAEVVSKIMSWPHVAPFFCLRSSVEY